MAKALDQGELFPSTDSREAVFLNARCQIRRDGDQRMVLVAGMPVAHFSAGDRMAAANAMVMLVECGWAQQIEAARAFACDVRTVRRAQERFEEGGLAALGRAAGYPRGRRRDRGRDGRVAQLKAEGCSNREIARRLGCSDKAVRKRLRRLGFTPAQAVQAELPLPTPTPAAQGADPNLSGPAAGPVEKPAPALGSADPNLSGPKTTETSQTTPAEELPFTLDDDPADRRWDRLFAYLGLLDDAAPLFRDGQAVPRAGVLLTIPVLLGTGVLDAARQVWGSIGPAFYGLRTSIVAMLLMALLRIKRPEALKEHSPPDLGRILGLDRAPEVKTLRRKLSRLAASGGAELFGRLLAQHRVSTHGHALGFLYVDGHVRIYYGQRRIPKTHAARIHAVTSATTDYWVNDQRGDPLFVVTAQANAGVVKMLPGLLDQIRQLVGDRRVTVVFDRGGYSPKLFVKVLAAGFDILTYRKGRWPKLPRRAFKTCRAVVDGQQIEYVLADKEVRLLGGKLRLRQVVRLCDEHQTPVLTSRRDLGAVEVAYRMFERWRQENFFKYLREEFLLDALVDYGTEPDDPAREVPNPKRIDLDERLKRIRAMIAELQRQVIGANALEAAGVAPKVNRGALARKIGVQARRAIALAARRDRIPRRVPIAKTTDEDIIKLATQKKHLTNVLKLVAYQAESELVRMIEPHYRRADEEGRTLVQTVMASAADIKVTDTELLVTLAPLSSPHRSRALAALCEQLNATATTFPGSRLRLRYALQPPPPVGLAFPGPRGAHAAGAPPA